ncbi:MAG: tetratricopeptide repeat protein [Pseudomonadota bacterium]
MSTDHSAAAEAYSRAVDDSVLFVGDPLTAAAEALAADPDLVLAHTLLAMYNLLGNNRTGLAEALAAIEAAEAAAGGANRRELGHIAATRAWYEGDFAAASLHWDTVLTEYPRDLFALQMGHLLDFYMGNAFNLRDRVARVLPAWSADTPLRDAVSGMYAFGLEEAGNYRQAEDEGRRAVEADKRDSWAAHAVAHVMEMEVRPEEGEAWLTATSNGWGCGNFTVHNWWHLALYRLDLGDFAGALTLYDGSIHYPGQEFVEELLDAAALLWRMDLIGQDVGDRWQTLAEHWLHLKDDGRYAFNDIHGMMCFVRSGRRDAAASLVAALEQEASGTKTTSGMARDIGLPVARAIGAFADEDYGQVVELLLPIRYDTRLFGGSHAQRDVLAQTLIVAAIRDGQKSLAHALLAERAATKRPTEASFTSQARAALA